MDNSFPLWQKEPNNECFSKGLAEAKYVWKTNFEEEKAPKGKDKL